jgi:hypothetical protein
MLFVYAQEPSRASTVPLFVIDAKNHVCILPNVLGHMLKVHQHIEYYLQWA